VLKEEDKLENEESVGLVACMNGNYFQRNYVWNGTVGNMKQSDPQGLDLEWM